MSGYPQYNNGVPPQQPYVQFASPYPRPMTSNGAVPQQSQQPTNNNNNYIPTPANAMYGAEQGQGGARMRRQNTLSRPERSRSTRRPMMRDPNAAPPLARQGATTHRPAGTAPAEQAKEPFDCWVCCSRCMTFWAVPWCLINCGKMSDKPVQQAWREKVTLCLIILFMCVGLGYLTFGFRITVCPESANQAALAYYVNGQPAVRPYVTVAGMGYNYEELANALRTFDRVSLGSDWVNNDITMLFKGNPSACDEFTTIRPEDCVLVPTGGTNASSVLKSDLNRCVSFDVLNTIQPAGRVAFDWSDVSKDSNLLVYNGAVVNLTKYRSDNSGSKYLDARFGELINEALSRDGTKTFHYSTDSLKAAACLTERYIVGYVDKETVGCFASEVVTIVSFIVIIGVVMIRFIMALVFSWILAPKLTSVKSKSDKSASASASDSAAYGAKARESRNSFLPNTSRFSTQPNISSTDMTTRGNGSKKDLAMRGTNSPEDQDDLYTIILVTCYSEGEVGIRNTLESLAGTSYPDEKKLLFVVADGMITGSGNDRSTPDIIVDMLSHDPAIGSSMAMSYLAIADGTKQHNMAKIYAGYFENAGRRVPMVAVVKVGTDAEANAPKPGNRGKRDSQLILMNFLSRVMFDDRMTPFDYDLFCKIQAITGVTPDKYEIILMVDADTIVMENSLRNMINAMKNDTAIMGLCGETRIANKTASWVSAIQVFEYYISHHLSKAFESVFGGVTCLPGCFCMYRIKAPKGPSGHWVPILVNPDIVEEYSENVVDTLHKKNLLLLGEDRFLSTLMLRNFPKRKMIFVPQAICKTVVPDEFRVLLSQRRRWINSTIHNLLELVLVRDLCGIFCFSMQFVIFLELVGTVVLPAAICFTIYLIVSSIVSSDPQVLPLLMLAAILGLPGLLILITTPRKVVYVLWMFVYLLSLPIWNFVLPTYAFWHFDDFSWGQTRKVEGESSKDDHSKKDGIFDSGSVQLKRWHEWEKERRMMFLRAREASVTTLYNGMDHLPPTTVPGTPMMMAQSMTGQSMSMIMPPQHQPYHSPMLQHHQSMPAMSMSMPMSMSSPTSPELMNQQLTSPDYTHPNTPRLPAPSTTAPAATRHMSMASFHSTNMVTTAPSSASSSSSSSSSTLSNGNNNRNTVASMASLSTISIGSPVLSATKASPAGPRPMPGPARRR